MVDFDLTQLFLNFIFWESVFLGLSPIGFNFARKRVKLSYICCGFCIIWIIIICLATYLYIPTLMDGKTLVQKEIQQKHLQQQQQQPSDGFNLQHAIDVPANIRLPFKIYNAIYFFGNSIFHISIIFITLRYRHQIIYFVTELMLFQETFFVNNINFHPIKIEFFRRTILISCYLIAFLTFNYISYVKEHSEHFSFSNFLDMINDGVPLLVVRVSSTWFYGGVILLCHYFRVLNEKLEVQIVEANKVFVEGKLSTKLTVNCIMSDFIDQICIFHGGLTNLTRYFNEIFDLPILLIFGNSIFVIITKVNNFFLVIKF